MPGSRAAAERELLGRRLAAQGIEPAFIRSEGEQTPAATPNARGRAGGQAPDARARAAAITAVVERLLAVQAQDFGQALWALGVRAPGTTTADVDAALESRSVVRSWPMRGTLHFTGPDDLRGLLALTSARTVRGMAARHRDLALHDDDFSRASDVARTELAGGGRAGRQEFLDLLEGAGVDTSGQRGMHLIWRLAHDALVCWGPRSGTQQALVLLDEWAPALRAPAELSEAAASGELAGGFLTRYLRGRGPATLRDFCWWSKLTVAEATAGLVHAGEAISRIDVGGAEYLVAESTRPAHPEPVPPAPPRSATGHHALPGFDEYLLGYQSRSPALAPEFAERIVPGGNGVFLPMLVSRGRIVGTWKRRTGATAVTVTLEPFESLSGTARAGFERSLRRYARFLGLELRLDEVPA
ncbi:winged helix DNA-binding domain-containing protein [Herbiconiux moechotypicola]|uniref:Winged helix DNA-binding domain-containing protein n=1 Tax=Herbiconiux moechotypicola TaxID=637393 RepID=A0ABN3E3T5_9MICO|nr:winged helix DNA-binding domain-containing protein [Herbiconiux moechotypicola]MCS5731631.1 winged helix DNA-binding domain-containing protein [Herbiconiux moechotypicola]